MPFDSTPSPVVTNADIIDEAIGLIEERGWCQGEAEDTDGRFCILGSLHRAAVLLTRDSERAIPLYLRTDELTLGVDAGGAIMWNDTPGRTKDEVIAKLREMRTKV